MRIAIFCEAPRDFETATALIDRLLCAHASWVADLFPNYREAARTWVPDAAGRTYFDLHRWQEEARRRGIRIRRGHFGPALSHAGSVMARHVFLLAAHEHQREPIDAVVLIWDADGDAKDRRAGIDQAREEAAVMPFAIVVALADRMREAWVLAGFEPQDDNERARLACAARDLGFFPNEEPHRLQDADEGAARNAKRVLASLSAGDLDRERICVEDAPLSVLRSRGDGSGLRHFLDEIAQRLVPLANPTPRSM